jgi:hypothetical protein
VVDPLVVVVFVTLTLMGLAAVDVLKLASGGPVTGPGVGVGVGPGAGGRLFVYGIFVPAGGSPG